MLKRHCMFQPLNRCIVGRSYAPEFYNFIADVDTRSRWQRIAEETEEDYQHLINLLHSFNVETIRPTVDHQADFVKRKTSNAWFKQFGFQNNETDYPIYDCVIPPPMEPRDWFMMMGEQFIHWLKPEQMSQYQNILDYVELHGNSIAHSDTVLNAEGWITKVGQLITYSLGGAQWFPQPTTEFDKFVKQFASEYDNRYFDIQGFADGVYRPLKPGVLLSLYESPRYASTFPDWDVISVLNDSWSKMDKWLEYKASRSYKMWNLDGDTERKELAYEWLDNGWQDYCSRNVFDANILSIDEKNVVVFNYNEHVFTELKKHNITPRISHFRHRYFWGGGIHCITSDIDREGDLENYFGH
tara:strand:- start:261 stop:1328 length:1068 start_codon:yes stop_codon:yes gene_type:complete